MTGGETMELLIFFICSWVCVSVLLFILLLICGGHPEENETWIAFIFSIILFSGIVTIAGVLILYIGTMIFLGVLALFGVIG